MPQKYPTIIGKLHSLSTHTHSVIVVGSWKTLYTTIQRETTSLYCYASCSFLWYTVHYLVAISFIPALLIAICITDFLWYFHQVINIHICHWLAQTLYLLNPYPSCNASGNFLSIQNYNDSLKFAFESSVTCMLSYKIQKLTINSMRWYVHILLCANDPDLLIY